MGAALALTEDNPNFFYDDTNNRLGLGSTSTASYTSRLLIYATNATSDDSNIAFDGAAFASGTHYRGFGFYDGGVQIGGFNYKYAAGTKTFEFGTIASNRIDLYTNSLVRMSVDGGGTVGINTVSTGSRLNINGNLSLGASYVGTAAPTNGAIIQGNVGIGMTQTLTKLTVKGDTTTVATGTTTVNGSTTVTGSGTLFLTELAPGDRISLSSAATTFRTVISIASNTSMIVDNTVGNGTSQTINIQKSVATLFSQGGLLTLSSQYNGRLQIGDPTMVISGGMDLFGNSNAEASGNLFTWNNRGVGVAYFGDFGGPYMTIGNSFAQTIQFNASGNQNAGNSFFNNALGKSNAFGIGAANRLSKLTVTPQAEYVATGTTTANASTTITGSGTAFTDQIGIGDRISLSSASTTYATVTAIASDTSLTVDTALGTGASQTINVRKSAGRLNAIGGAGGLLVNDQGKVSIGPTYFGPSAYLHLGAGTATAGTAPLKQSTGTLLTALESGTYEFDGNNHSATCGTLRGTLPRTLFTQTADKTVTNTVTETSIIGTGVATGGGMTQAANALIAGRTLRLRIGGIYSTPALATPSLIIKVKLGSVVIATVTTSSLLSGASSLEFDGEVLITCRTTGGSGTVMTHGDIEYSTGIAGTIAVDSLNNGGATTTIDTTISNLLDVTVQWDAATSTRIAKSTVATLEVLN